MAARGPARNGARLRPGIPNLEYTVIAVLTIKRDKSTFRLVLRDAIPKEPLPKCPPDHSQKQLFFGIPVVAETFLRGFSNDRIATAGLSNLLAKIEGTVHSGPPPNDWIDRLASHLISGKLLASEVAPLPKGSGSASKPPKKEEAVPFARRAAPVDQAEPPEQSTFSNSNERNQAGSLIAAAASGKPFCEVCNKT
jgi:hypothetical protein